MYKSLGGLLLVIIVIDVVKVNIHQWKSMQTYFT